MNDLESPGFEEALGKHLAHHLGPRGYDVLDLIPIPAGDSMLRLRALESAIQDFDRLDDSVVSYVVQVRRRDTETVPEPQTHARISAPAGKLDGIYNPDGKLNVEYLLENAEILYRSGDFTLSRNIYKTILQSGERSALALLWIARCDESEGKTAEALANYEESIAYHPSLDALQNYSSLLIREKKDHQAAESLERALTLKDLNDEIRFEIHKACGNCWMRAEKGDRAERHYRSALGIRPGADEIRANLGSLALHQGKIADARNSFQDALAANPRNDKALVGLASCYMHEGEKRLAHDYYAKALDVQLNNSTAIYYLVKCAYEIKSYAVAARLVEDYMTVAPVNANLMFSLAGLQFHLGRLDEARSTATRILNLQPGHSGAKEILDLVNRTTGIT